MCLFLNITLSSMIWIVCSSVKRQTQPYKQHSPRNQTVDKYWKRNSENSSSQFLFRPVYLLSKLGTLANHSINLLSKILIFFFFGPQQCPPECECKMQLPQQTILGQISTMALFTLPASGISCLPLILIMPPYVFFY